jgi:protein-tyrosine phosphatase
MAEAALRSALDHNGRAIAVRSAGLDALVGHPADQNAQTVARQRGLDISEHRAVQVNRTMLHWADLILVMEDAQRAELRDRQPDTAGKTLLLGHWDQSQIPDPYRGELHLFEQTMDLIVRSIAAWMTRI